LKGFIIVGGYRPRTSSEDEENPKLSEKIERGERTKEVAPSD